MKPTKSQRFHQIACQRASSRYRLLAIAAIGTVLSACGGGGSSSMQSTADQQSLASASSFTDGNAETDASISTQVPSDTTTAQATLVETSQAIVDQGEAGTSIACPGGGTAVYEVSLDTGSGLFAAGVVYTFSFDNCTGQTGAATFNGIASVDVKGFSASNLDANLNFSNLSVVLARDGNVFDTMTLNGGDRIQTATTTANGITTQVAHLTASNLSVTSSFTSGRVTSYALSAVDMQKSVTSAGGVASSTSYQGTTTLAVQTNQRAESLTVATQGSVSYSSGGTPIQGQWLISLPNNALSVNAQAGVVTIGLDLGGDGTVDRTLTLPIREWLSMN